MGFFSRVVNLARGVVKTAGTPPNEAALRALDEELARGQGPRSSQITSGNAHATPAHSATPLAPTVPAPLESAPPATGPVRDERGDVKRTL